MRRYVVLTVSLLFITVLCSPIVPVADSKGIEMNSRDVPIDFVEMHDGEMTVEYYKSESYTPHAPMNITSNADFVTEGWSGSGTQENPYTIELLEIVADGTCLIIANTTAFFAILNCSFTSSSLSSNDGLVLRNITNGAIAFCEFQSLNVGVSLESCHETNITDSNIRNCYHGFSIFGASNLNILRNTVNNGSYGGFLLDLTDSVIAENEIFDMFFAGFYLTGSGNDTLVADNIIYDIALELWWNSAIQLGWAWDWQISSNTIYNCYAGIQSDWESFRNIIDTNNLTDNNIGIQIDFSEESEISYNTIKGGITGIQLYECDDIVIKGNVIEASRYRGLSIRYSINCEITGNTFDAHGISIEGFAPSQYRHSVSNNFIGTKSIGFFLDDVNTTIPQGNYGQVFLVNCSGVTVSNQNITNGYIGVVIAYSEDCTISACSIYDNVIAGISLIFSYDCNIEGNSIHHNGHLYSNSGGISLMFTNNTSIVGNLVYANNGTGIHIYLESSYCLIYNNLITNNTIYGIYIYSENDHIRIFGNALGWNNECDAVDFGTNNEWDDGIGQGNWWQLYNGTGVYEIDGRANSIDNYPMMYEMWELDLPMGEVIGIEFIVLSIAGVAVGIIVVLIILRKRHVL